ncbi:MAG TPA: hypothetical protein VF826_02200 [Chloroflexia bacterium]
MSLAFVDRDPTAQELERLRLILSTYQDGSGMLVTKSSTLPGWRDFERAVAATFGGIAQESKAVFDVLLPDEQNRTLLYGLSCKMREELDKVNRTGRVTMELSNSAKAFWSHLGSRNITQSNYRSYPAETGTALIELVRSWHDAVSTEHGGRIDTSRSCYLVLSYNLQGGAYQLHQFSLQLPDPASLEWYFPSVVRLGTEAEGKRLTGRDDTGIVFEWYGESGGQLKYYPLAQNAIWQSRLFELEPLPAEQSLSILLKKARDYFPDKWVE